MGRIIIEKLPASGQTIESRKTLDGKITIGRSYANDLILEDPYVSARHLVLANVNGKIHLKDLNSENGTFLDANQRINGKTLVVPSGSVVTLGHTRLKLLLPNHPLEPTKPFEREWGLRRFVDRPWVPTVLLLALVTLGVLLDYLEQPNDKYWNKAVYTSAVAYGANIFMGAGFLSLYTFYRYKKSYYVRNLAIAVLGLFLFKMAEILEPFLHFWILNPKLGFVVDCVVFFLIVFFTLWASVRMVKDSLQWSEVARLAWVPLVFIVLALFGREEMKSENYSNPVIHSHMAPGLGPLAKPATLDEFLQSGAEEFANLPNDKNGS